MRLGDLTEKALSLCGITKERVEKWLGRPCRCKERQAKLNALGRWVQTSLSRLTGMQPQEQAKDEMSEHLKRIMGDD